MRKLIATLALTAVFSPANQLEAADPSGPTNPPVVSFDELRRYIYADYAEGTSNHATKPRTGTENEAASKEKPEETAAINLLSKDTDASQIAADSIQRCFPSSSKWYLKPFIEPLSDPTDKIVSCAGGNVVTKDVVTLRVNDKEAKVNVYCIGGSRLLSNMRYRHSECLVDIVIPNDVLVAQELLAQRAKDLDHARETVSDQVIEDFRSSIAESAPRDDTWHNVRIYLTLKFAKSLTAGSADKKMYDAVMLMAAGQLSAYNDPDFCFALTHSGSSIEDKYRSVALRGEWDVMCDREFAVLGVESIIQEANPLDIDPDEIWSGPARDEAVYMLNWLCARLAGLSVHGWPVPKYSIDDSILKDDLNAETVSVLARKIRPEVFVEWNVLMLRAGMFKHLKMSDQERDQRSKIILNAATLYPGKPFIRLVLAEDLADHGKASDAEAIFCDLAEHCDIDRVATMAALWLAQGSMKRDDWDQTGKWVSMAIVKEPRNPDVLFDLLAFQVKKGDTSSAAETRNRFLQLEPTGIRADGVRKLDLQSKHN